MRVAIDIGYGFVKAMNEKGVTTRFPSVVAIDRSTKMRNILKFQDEDYTVRIWDTADTAQYKSYLVGDAAMVGGSGIRTWEDKAVENTNLQTLIATAAALLCGDEEIDLAVGLPLTYYRAQKDEVTELLRQMNVQVAIGEQQAKQVKIRSVYVFPQGAGAYYAACLTIDGEVRNPHLVNSPVGLIDIGYRTTDILVMAKGKKGLMPREDLSGGIDLGMKHAYHMIQDDVEELVNKTVDFFAIEKAILWDKGKFLHKGLEISLKEYEFAAYEELAQQISAKVKMRWGDELDGLSAVIVAGGGGESLEPYLKLAFPSLIKIENAAFANVEGFLAAQGLSQRRAKV